MKNNMNSKESQYLSDHHSAILYYHKSTNTEKAHLILLLNDI